VVRLRIDTAKPLEPQLPQAADAVRSGGVVAFPTDTLYGLGANPFDAAAVDAVFALKGRGANQPLPLVAADVDQLKKVATLNSTALRLASAFWPGPLTLLLPSTTPLAPGVASPDGLVGVRVPNSDIARALADAAGHPVTATSANRSGEPATADPDVVAATLPGITLLVDGGPSPGGLASTIVDVSAAPRLVREGAIRWSRVLEFLDAPDFR
jgi:L-threonylcarbamoyladenylate synthase